jgi:hypothetical protein
VRGDKQLRAVELEDVLEKRRLGQPLDAKSFARLAGIGYSRARQWFNTPGFPIFEGLVFWEDFVRWRNVKTGLAASSAPPSQRNSGELANEAARPTPSNLPARAMRILDESNNGTEPVAPKMKAA